MRLELHYFLVPKHAKWLIAIGASFFTLLILIEFAFLLSLPYNLSDSSKKDVKPEAPIKVDTTSYLLETAIFGVYVPNDLNVDTIKKSVLDVTLVGILLAKPLEDSQVIIKAANGEEKTYLLGDTIPGGAIIKRITAGSVLVERAGALESLSLPKDDLTFEPIPKPLKEE